MNRLFAALVIVLVSHQAQAAAGMANLYVRAAAAWEQCTGNTLTAEHAASLSDLIARHTLETVAPDDVMGEVRKARAAIPAGCDLPLVQIDRDYFQKFVLPRLEAAQGQTSPAAAARVAGA